MSNKTVAPNGKVVQGDYSGLNVYIRKIDKCLQFIEGVIDYSVWFPSYFDVKKILYPYTIRKYELVSTYQESGASNVSVGAAALFYGRDAATTLMNAVKVNRYKVAIYFKDGEKSLIDIDEEAYSILVDGCFSFE